MGWGSTVRIQALWLVAAVGVAAAQVPETGVKPPAAPATRLAEPAPTTVKQMLTPTRISFKANGLKADDAITELEKSIGFSLHNAPDPIGDDKNVTFDEKNQAMLSVISALAQKTKTRIVPFPRGRDEPFVLENLPDPSSCFYIPKQIDASIMPFIATLAANKENGKYHIDMQISLALEPKVFVAAYVHSANWDTVIDDQGVSLFMSDPAKQKPAGSPGRPLEYLASGNSVTTWARIHYPSAKAVTIKRIRGAIPVLFGFNLNTLDLSPVLDDGKTARLPYLQNTSIVLSDFGREPNSRATYEMNMAVPRLLLPDGTFVDDNAALAPMRFEATDDDHHSWAVHRESSHTSDKILEFKLKFHPQFPILDKDKDKRIYPTKFVLIAPGRTEGALIPFEFTDIPIPAIKK